MRATLLYINWCSITLVLQINNISIRMMGIGSKSFSTNTSTFSLSPSIVLLVGTWLLPNCKLFSNYNNKSSYTLCINSFINCRVTTRREPFSTLCCENYQRCKEHLCRYVVYSTSMIRMCTEKNWNIWKSNRKVQNTYK